MKAVLNTDIDLVEEIKQALKANQGYCPCVIEHTPETKCMCKDFKENVPVGETCHCGLYIKVQ